MPCRAHVECFLNRAPAPSGSRPDSRQRRGAAYTGTIQQDKELQAIFERTYGPVKNQELSAAAGAEAVTARPEEKRAILPQSRGPEYLLVDGYNIIFAWEELKAAARDSLYAARKQLCDLLCNYQGVKKCVVIVVFDAYQVKGGLGSVERYHNIHVVYTREAETADAYIERTTYEIGREHRVKVATSDGPEQLIILGHGALRLSASAFRDEVEEALRQMARAIDQNNRQERDGAVRSALEKAREKGETEL